MAGKADKVDALAVLDDLIADMGDLPGTQGHKVVLVRAAMAELIEAGAALVDSQSGPWERGTAYISARGAENMNAAMKRTRAALALAGGAA